MAIEPSGYEATTAFMVRYLAGDRVKRRIALVSRGYWEVMSAMGILFAANMLRELSGVVEKMPLEAGGFGKSIRKTDGNCNRAIKRGTYVFQR